MIREVITEGTKEIIDDFNPRIYKKYYKCKECMEWVEEEDTVWVSDNPFHVECAPEQEE